MGSETGSTLVLLRFSGDLGTKGRGTRHQFAARLLHNLRDALTTLGVRPRVRLSHDRIFVELPAGTDPTPLAGVFAVQSLSPVLRRTPAELEAVVAAGSELFGPAVRGRRFAVRARRVGSREAIPIGVRELERRLGAALEPGSAGVDLSNPEVVASIELFEGEAYLLGPRIEGHGGLPLGVEGRCVTLVSGGFDSAVAAWLLARRGVAQDYLFCNLGGATHELGTLRVMKVLADRWSFGTQPRLFSVDFEPIVAELRERTRQRYWQVLLKRLMLRAAERLADERGAPAIATGEAVGQVSSQTLQNLSVISRASRRALLRPLVGFNKEEIIALARRIGTFELSRLVREYCAIVPSRPATAATLSAIEAEEVQLDPETLERSVSRPRTFDLRELDVGKLELPGLELSRLPDGAVVIDLRPRARYETWHPEGALHLEFAQALRAYPSFAREGTYVFYCDLGLLSAHLAEQMRREGFNAFHFRGGTRALRKSLSD